MRILLLTALLIFSMSAALAESRVMAVPASGECLLNKTANISISFQSIETDISGMEAQFAGKKRQILELSRQADIEKLLLSSLSYSASPQSGFQYNVSGSFSFSVVPANRAPAFLKLLAKEGFNANLSMSAYPSAGNCDLNLPK